MIDAEQAKQRAKEHLWGSSRKTVKDLEDAWESPEERAQMTEWMLRWYDEGQGWRVAETEPEEIPVDG